MSEPAAQVSVQEIAPTAEHGWLWRRLFSFVLSAALLTLILKVIRRTTDQQVLRFEAMALCVLLALVIAFYMGGATLTDIWRLVSAVRTTEHITATKVEP